MVAFAMLGIQQANYFLSRPREARPRSGCRHALQQPGARTPLRANASTSGSRQPRESNTANDAALISCKRRSVRRHRSAGGATQPPDRKAHRVRRPGPFRPTNTAARAALLPTMHPQGFAALVLGGRGFASCRRTIRPTHVPDDAHLRGSAPQAALVLFESGGRRSPACQCDAGHWPQRFLAASSVRAIRDSLTTTVGACRDGRWLRNVLLAAGATEFKRRPMSRRAEPTAGFGEGQRRMAITTARPKTP